LPVEVNLQLYATSRNSPAFEFRRINGYTHGIIHERRGLTPAFRMGQGDPPELSGTPPLKEGHNREIAPPPL